MKLLINILTCCDCHKHAYDHVEARDYCTVSNRQIITVGNEPPEWCSRRNKIMTTKDAIDHLINALATDEGYYISWQANIAVMFQDVIAEHMDLSEAERIRFHEISNEAAKRFLNMFISTDDSNDKKTILIDNDESMNKLDSFDNT